MRRCRRASAVVVGVAVRRLGAWTGLGGAGVRVFLGHGRLAMLAVPRQRAAVSADGRSVAWFPRSAPAEDVREEDWMGWLDKLLGRTKKAAGDVTGDSSLRREGEHQEQAAAATDRAESYESMAQEERTEAAEHQARQEDQL